jgi:pyrroloquinoline quinone biosynthesis protein D
MFRLQWEAVQKAWVLLYPEGMVKLNPSAGEIMKRLNAQTTVAALIADLEATFSSPDLAPEVLAFLCMAQEQGWVLV